MENSNDDEESWAAGMRFMRRAWYKVFSLHHGVEARDFHGTVVAYTPYPDDQRSGEWDPDEDKEA
jgi:hypothetical protein